MLGASGKCGKCALHGPMTQALHQPVTTAHCHWLVQRVSSAARMAVSIALQTGIASGLAASTSGRLQAPLPAYAKLAPYRLHTASVDLKAVLAQPSMLRPRMMQCRATGPGNEQRNTTSNQPEEEQQQQLLYTLGIGALWVALAVYAFLYSPNQTPYRDQIFLKLLVGLREPGEDFVVNQVYTALFNIMGIWPLIYACLLIPGGRSDNKLPAWPFVSASFGVGVFALLPYFAFWRPAKDQTLPPKKEELEGWNRLVMKGAETPVLPGLLIAGTLGMFFLAATAGPAAWAEYGRLLDESRLVHVTTLDFLCLCALAPFWMRHDAEGRNWEQREQLLPILSFIPVLGPAIYLLLRPKTDLSK